MASEVELERMVIRLIGDASNYLNALKEVGKETERTASQVEGDIAAISKTIEDFSEGMVKAGKVMTKYVTTPLLAAAGLATAAYAIQERAEKTLQGVMEANETYSKSLFEDYKNFAAGLEGITTTGDETSLVLLRTAEAMGLSGAAAKTAVREAISLTSAFDMSARSAVLYTSRLAHGSVGMLKEYIPALRNVEDEAEAVALAHEHLARMFHVATTGGETYAGAMKQLYNELGTLFEQVGEIIAKVLRPAIASIRGVVKWFTDLSEGAKTAMVVILAVTAAIGPMLIAIGSIPIAIGAFVLALGVLASFPIIILLSAIAVGAIAVTAAIAALVVEWINWNDAVKEGNEIAAKSANAADKLIRGWRGEMDELRYLASKQELSNNEMDRAQELIDSLGSDLGGLGITLDKATGKFHNLAEGMDEAMEAAKRLRVTAAGVLVEDLERQLAEAEAKAGAVPRATPTPGTFGGGFGLYDVIREPFDEGVDELKKQLEEAKSVLAEARAGVLPEGDWKGPAKVEVNDATKAAMVFEQQLKEQLATVGKTADEAQRMKLEFKAAKLELEGADPAIVASVRKLIEDIDKGKDAASFKTIFEGLADEILTVRGEIEGVDQELEDFLDKDPTEGQLSWFKNQTKELERFKQVLADKKDVERLEEMFTDPFKVAMEQIKKYKQLKDEAGLSEEAFNLAVEQSIKDYESTLQGEGAGATKPEAVQTIARGSVDEMLLMQEHRMAMTVRERTPAEKDRENLEKIAEGTRDTATHTQAIAEAVAGGIPLIPADLGAV